MAVIAMMWLTGKLDEWPSWVDESLNQTNLFLGFSLLVLLLMNFDRYLAAYYPIFHRTTVTKAGLVALLLMLILSEVLLDVMCLIDELVLSHQNGLLIFLSIILSPMLYINFKLLTVVRKRRKNNKVSPATKQTFSLKNISSCLLAVACFLILSIPSFVYIGLKMTSKATTFRLDKADMVGIWAKTIGSMNGTFNCLIFFWRNKILRAEGMKIIKSLRKKRILIQVRTREGATAN
jgi:hypothetical protein